MATYKRGSGNYKSSFLQIFIKKTGQDVNNSETLVNCTELAASLKANKVYTGMLQLRISSPTAADLDITFADISGATGDVFVIGGGSQNSPSTTTSMGAELGVTTSAGNEVILVYFWITVGSTPGTLQLQFAQTVATVGNTTIQAGSSMMVVEA